jgi:hypothetical protein
LRKTGSARGEREQAGGYGGEREGGAHSARV